MQYGIVYHTTVYTSEGVTWSHALTKTVATDHLGSICQLLEPDGTVVEETNYDTDPVPFIPLGNCIVWFIVFFRKADQSDYHP